ncbi:MAG: Mut7-C RNAse domain-containing protein [Desulfomonilaceae bacterium]
MEIWDDVSQQPCFDVDGMLGRLAKWLRILGFDAAYPRSAPTADRYFVTTRKQKGILQIIIVTANDSMQQLKQVLTAISVRPDPSMFFSRCLICNIPVVEISRADAAGQVPEEIFGSRSEFHECPRCRRVYWEGSHLSRMSRRLKSVGLA